MRFAGVWFFVLIFLGWSGGVAIGAEVSVRLLAGDGAREQGWETVAVEVLSPGSGGKVSVTDVRGGLRVERALPDAARGMAVRVLLPLPLVAPGQLSGGVWPVEVVVTGASGEIQKQVVEMGLPAVGMEATFRIGVVEADAVLPEGVNTVVRVSEEDLVNGPALVFAGCDAVIVPAVVMGKMSDERLEELLAVGVELMAESGERPSGLRAEDWAPLPGTGAAGGVRLWRYGWAEMPRVRVIEAGLERVGSLAGVVEVGSSVRWVVVGVVPAAVVVLFLVRGLFRRRLVIAGFLIVLMVGLAVGFIGLLRVSAPMSGRGVSWGMRFGALRLNERYETVGALFARAMDREVDEPGTISVAASSPRRYFAMGDAVLSLGRGRKDSLGRFTRLHVGLGDREAVTVVERSVDMVAESVGGGESLVGGYVTTTGGAVVFGQWAEQQGAMRDSLMGWYELRFDVGHRYEILRGKAEGADFRVRDFGLMGTATKAGSP